jgi:hypothetical protein
MFDLQDAGKMMIILGVSLAVIGALFLLGGRGGILGNLPGDIRINRGNWGCYIPLASCVIISLLLTLVVNIFTRLFK